jgi:hypothetical protein
VCTKVFSIGLFFAGEWDGGKLFILWNWHIYDTPEGGVHRDSGLRMDGIPIWSAGLRRILDPTLLVS